MPNLVLIIAHHDQFTRQIHHGDAKAYYWQVTYARGTVYSSHAAHKIFRSNFCLPIFFLFVSMSICDDLYTLPICIK